jgi:hypothetical protein
MKEILMLTLLCGHFLWAAPSFVLTSPQADSALLNNILLYKLSTGVRQKTFLKLNIYKVTLFASQKLETITLDTLLALPACALSIEFMRNVKATDLVKGFEDALKANKVQEYPELLQFKTLLKARGTLLKDQKIIISMNKTTNLLTCEQENKESIIIKANDKIFRDIFSIWFGIAADSGLAALKTNLSTTIKK